VTAGRPTDLLVEENVNERVVDCRGLGEDGRYRSKPQVERLPAKEA